MQPTQVGDNIPVIYRYRCQLVYTGTGSKMKPSRYRNMKTIGILLTVNLPVQMPKVMYPAPRAVTSTGILPVDLLNPPGTEKVIFSPSNTPSLKSQQFPEPGGGPTHPPVPGNALGFPEPIQLRHF